MSPIAQDLHLVYNFFWCMQLIVYHAAIKQQSFALFIQANIVVSLQV